MKPNDLTVVTFATLGSRLGQRDYSAALLRMRQNCKRLGVELLTSTFEGSGISEVNFEIEREIFLRKGAGYWHWKPKVIKKALSIAQSRYILYLDVDLHLVSLPNFLESRELEEVGLLAFETNEKLSDWSSKRCLKHFQLESDYEASIISASLILADSTSAIALKSLDYWENALKNRKLLLDPFWTIKTNHRHDQSVFSCLIATGSVKLCRLRQGFYQTGLNNGHNEIDNAWVIHGSLESKTEKEKLVLIHTLRSFLFHKVELAFFLLSNHIREVVNRK